MIDAFNEIISQKHNVILLIIGSGFDSEKGNELKRRAHNGIYFLGEKHNVQDYLLCSDAFCLSSIYEGLPITLIEALACGCIPLSTPVSGVVDLVVNNENGFISANFTLDSYVEMLLRYLKNHESINKQRLLELFRAKLSMRACAESYYDFYKYCLNNVGTGE
ncbi:glycosyltransferase family 4 protein [Bacteroides thetaiotaomicron]|uniref:glycosyltransferase family 4 protein n=1 Tax=Bacteroides thetaiotaomicron TaxID=818 RepID=UPI0021660490|nr:glycosyltransferase family 4 protein [Bacteroides thetaiotaomicron]MCS2910191.1 glycosyltransferase family 4 protein [Bacteroides thetaiotaomicron]